MQTYLDKHTVPQGVTLEALPDAHAKRSGDAGQIRGAVPEVLV